MPTIEPSYNKDELYAVLQETIERLEKNHGARAKFVLIAQSITSVGLMSSPMKVAFARSMLMIALDDLGRPTTGG